ncbi:MAG: hypothetical protein FJ202_09410 [Gemmatimonadetes bacterium]|nr:hypothetical protein [Gemmatimonadota bacterium]
MPGVSTLRVNLLRALYLLLFAGQASIQLPILIGRGTTLSFWQGVGASMLLSLALLSLVGVRYPLQMIPLLLFEFAWKLTWVIAIFLPRWLGGTLDAATAQSAPEIMAGVIVPLVIPWHYVVQNYVRKPGDPWRRPPAEAAAAGRNG